MQIPAYPVWGFEVPTQMSRPLSIGIQIALDSEGENCARNCILVSGKWRVVCDEKIDGSLHGACLLYL
jgi:hypothetical protein